MWAYAVHGRQDLAFLEHRRQFTFPDRALNLKMDQAIKRNQGRDLAFDEGIDFTDVPHHDGHETKGATGIPPREPRWNAHLFTVTDAWLFGDWNLSRLDSLNHVGPLGSLPVPCFNVQAYEITRLSTDAKLRLSR